MENCSNCTTAQPGTFQTTEYLVFSIVMLLTAVTAIFFNILTAVVLSTRKEVLLPIRILLVNLLAGVMFTAVAVVIQNMDSIILATHSNAPPIEALCRAYVWFFRSSAAVRLCNLAAYSIAVIVVVKKKKENLKPVHTLPVITVTWVYALLLSIHWIIPSALRYTFIDGIRCISQPNPTIPWLKMVMLSLWIIAGGIIPTIICITVITVALCYIRKLRVSEVSQFKKGLVRLALFLLLANISNLINMIVPPILVSVDPDLSITLYFITSMDTIMLWGTGIVLMIFIKPVKTKVAAILSCSWCKRQHSSSSSVEGQVKFSTSYKEVSVLDESSDISDWTNRYDRH